MSDVSKVLEWFEDGLIVRPSSEVLNFVDLVRALLRLSGADGIEESAGGRELAELIGRREHYVFVLVDGMGADMVRGLGEDSFLRSHLKAELQSVFPSTTATAITTLATSRWPAENGVPGWRAWLEDRKLSIVTLPFVERHSERSLEEVGVRTDEVFPVASVWGQLTHDALTVVPEGICESVYSKYSRGDTAGVGRTSIDNALEIVRDHVAGTARRSFTYVYFPELDGASHREGPESSQVRELLAEFDGKLAGLADALQPNVRIIITSDHGSLRVPEENRILVARDDPLAECVVCSPTGEPRVPVFHVGPGREEFFADEFRERFGGTFALLTPDEVEELRLMGTHPLSAIMRRRLGTFVGIARSASAIFFEPFGKNVSFKGHHAGLSTVEMTIPLIVS